MKRKPTRLPIPPKKDAERKGVVLVAVLIVIMLLSLAGYQYAEMMLAEYRVSESAHRAVQTRLVADSGVHYIAAMLSDPNFQNTLGGNPFNHEGFNGVAVGGEKVNGKFSLVAPADPNDPSAGFVFGIMDEGGKINLNMLMKLDVDQQAKGAAPGDLMHNVLIKLPNMTEEIVAAIIDWMDPDSDPMPGGAESDYYLSLNPPYRCKNGPIDSIDELLLVRGITRDLLYGTDWNRNGVPDGTENTSGSFDRGWSAYLTVHSREQNSDFTGKPFVYLNNPDMAQLYDDLKNALGDAGDDGLNLAKFIILYRQNGATKANGQSQSLGASLGAMLGLSSGSNNNSNSSVVDGDLSSYEVDTTKAPKDKGKFNSIFDLANAYVTMNGPTDPMTKKQTKIVYTSPVATPDGARNLLPKLFGIATLTDTTKYGEVPPRINVNTAPSAVIAALPNFTDTEIEKVMSTRPSLTSGELLSDPIWQTPTWLLTEAQIDVGILQKLEQYITTRTQVFRVQSVGYFEGKGPAVRVEAIIDTNGGRPRIIGWRNMTDLGKGWNVDMNP